MAEQQVGLFARDRTRPYDAVDVCVDDHTARGVELSRRGQAGAVRAGMEIVKEGAGLSVVPAQGGEESDRSPR